MRRGALAILAFALAVVAPRASAAPLTLDDAIGLALQNNQRVKVSAYNPQISRANLLTAYGAFDPVLTFNRSYGETEVPGALTPPTVRPITQADHYSLSLDGTLPFGTIYSIGATADNTRGSATSHGFLDSYVTFGGVSITQPLLRGFIFNSSLTTLRVAKANRAISDWQHKQTVIDTVTNVIFTFNNLQQARENLRISILSRDLAAQLANENQKKRSYGATSDAEVVQANARVANREESILVAERSLRDVENQLRLLIGETNFPVNGPALETVELGNAPDITVNAAEDVKKAYDLRPDYQAARLGITIDRANNALAQSNLLPTLNFVGSYGYGGASGDFPTARAQVRDEDARSYSAGMVVRVPLTMTDSRGRARAAKLTLRRDEADLVRLQEDIAITIASAAGQIETTKKRVAATKIALDLAQQELTNEQKRFTAGTSTTFLVSNAQSDLSAAQASYARAVADQRRAIASYERELGVTLVTHHIAVD